MSAGFVNFLIEVGNTFNITLEWRDENGTLVDLTGYTADLIFTSPRTLDLVTYYTLSTGNGRITLNSPGEIVLNIPYADTATFTPDIWLKGYGAYKLNMYSMSNSYRLIEGYGILRY